MDANPAQANDNGANVVSINKEEAEQEPKFIDTDKLRKFLKSSRDEFLKLKAQRKKINDKTAALLAEVAERGIDKKAFRYAVQRSEMTEEQRNDNDMSKAVCLKSMGVGYQSDMFEDEKVIN